MDTYKIEESPMIQRIGFSKLLSKYNEMAKSDSSLDREKAQSILNLADRFPILREGFTDVNLLEKYRVEINAVLADAFSPVLSNNEIKTAGVPFTNLVFKTTQRFDKILQAAGPEFELSIRNMPENYFYIMQCTVILGWYYGFNLDFKRPLYYDIPDANGVMRHYRILYNADFMEFVPTERAKKLTHKDLEELLEGFDDISLWKSKIPPESFIANGFVISNIFDVTAEHSISEIKSTLIGSNKRGSDHFMLNFRDTFRSLFNLPEIEVGFTGYDPDQHHFFQIHGKGINSYLLGAEETSPCDGLLCDLSKSKLLDDNSFYTVSNIEKYYNMSAGEGVYNNLHHQGWQSAILASIASEGKLLGILELVSKNKYELNSVNSQKLVDVMPYIVSAVLRSIEEEKNLIDAIIQNECTSVHHSVLWKFQEEAKRFLNEQLKGNNPVFKEISFKEVVPLFGQVDIVDSSTARNTAIQRDLIIQLTEISAILSYAWEHLALPIYEEILYRVKDHLEDISEVLYTNSEQVIFEFIKEEVGPVFSHLKRESQQLKEWIGKYESSMNPSTESYYDHRKNYDESVTEINFRLAALLDKRQKEAQQMYPHFFERYKTDGVEHNMYIGQSIAPDRPYNDLYLNNLRLWQLQVMVELENEYYQFKSQLKVPLDVASLLLVHSTALAIRFRMDEKMFDVDGTYNARYEIIKKRIDKSYIKGTNERLTEKGKIAIVYSQKKEEREYLRYVQFLKSKNYFTNKIEIVELEGLHGVTGLKAIRAEILYKKNENSQKHYTYEDLMATLLE